MSTTLDSPNQSRNTSTVLDSLLDGGATPERETCVPLLGNGREIHRVNTRGMDAGLVKYGSPSVAQSKHSLQVARLRNRVVWSQSLLSWAAFLSAFYLAVNSLAGSQYFLITGLLFTVVASVTATCEKVSIQDLPKISLK